MMRLGNIIWTSMRVRDVLSSFEEKQLLILQICNLVDVRGIRRVKPSVETLNIN